MGLRDRVAIIQTLISPPLIRLRRLCCWRGLVEVGRRGSDFRQDFKTSYNAIKYLQKEILNLIVFQLKSKTELILI